MIRTCLAALLLVAACRETTPPLRGIATRVVVDRTEARVGDAIGVTVEVETPEGFAMQPPAAPAGDERFYTERLERLRPERVPGGVRHRLLWTLRARAVGEHAIPRLGLPLAGPDGRIQQVPAGGVPLSVVSVRGDLPDREVWFDIRPPPPVDGSGVWVWISGASAAVALAAAALLWIRRRGAALAGEPRPGILARDALRELDSALGEPDPRLLADRVQAILRDHVVGLGAVSGDAWTPEELPGTIAPAIVGALRSLESERFAREPRLERVTAAARTASSHLTHVAGNA